MAQELKKLKAADKKITELEKIEKQYKKVITLGSSIYIASLINCVFFCLVASQEWRETTKTTRETTTEEETQTLTFCCILY